MVARIVADSGRKQGGNIVDWADHLQTHGPADLMVVTLPHGDLGRISSRDEVSDKSLPSSSDYWVAQRGIRVDTQQEICWQMQPTQMVGLEGSES